MDEKYLQNLYNWIVSQDPTYKDDYTYDAFKQKMQDENSAKNMYNWVSSIDNTFSKDMPVEGFIQKVKIQPTQPAQQEPVKKKDITASSLAVGSSEPSAQVSGQPIKPLEFTQPRPTSDATFVAPKPNIMEAALPKETKQEIAKRNEAFNKQKKEREAIEAAERKKRRDETPKEKDFFTGTFGDFLRAMDASPLNPIKVGDLIDDTARAIDAGFKNGAIVTPSNVLMFKGNSPDAIKKFVQATKEYNESNLGPSDEMQKFTATYEDNGKDWWAFLKALGKNPDVLPELLVSTFSTLLNPSSIAAAGTVVGGAAVGGAVGGGGVGAVPATLASIPYAMGAANVTLETGLTFSELLQEELSRRGLELTEDNVQKVLENEDALRDLRAKSVARGAAIGLIDAITGRVAGRVGAKISSKVAPGAVKQALLSQKAKAGIVGAGIEMVGGAAGETAGRVAAGQELDIAEIGLEGIAEGPMAIPSIAAEVLKKPVYMVNGVRTSESDLRDIIERNTPEDLAKVNIEIKNDKNGFGQIIQDKVVTNQIKNEVRTANPDLNEESLDAITNLEKELRKLEGNKTEVAKDKVSALKQQIKEIQENPLKPKEDAIQEQGADAGVLRTEQPQLGLQEMGEGNAQPEVVTAGEEQVQALTPEEETRRVALQEALSQPDNGKGTVTVGEELVPREQAQTEFDQLNKVYSDTQQQEVAADVFSDVDSTAKALEGVDITTKFSPTNPEDKAGNARLLAEQYHKDKAAGEETDVTKAVEDLLKDVKVETKPIADPAVLKLGDKVVVDGKEKTVLSTFPALEQVLFDDGSEYTFDEVRNATKPTERAVTTATETTEQQAARLEEMLGQEPEIAAEDTGVSISNKASVADLMTRTTDRTKKVIIESAARAVRTLKSILPDFDIVIHDNEGSYNKAVTAQKGRLGSAGNFSVTRRDGKIVGGRIDINLSKADITTVAHEVAHGVMLKAFGDNPALFKVFRNRISKILSEETNKNLNEFASEYSETESHEEFIVQLAAALSANRQQLSKLAVKRIEELINKIVSKLTNGAIVPFKITKEITDTNQLINFLNGMSSAIAKGEKIAVKERGKIGNVPTVLSKSQTPVKDIDVKSIRTKARPGNRISKGLSVRTENKKKVVAEAEELSLDYVKRNAPEVFISNAKILANYPIVAGVQRFDSINTVQDAEKVYKVFSRQVADNLKFLIKNFKKELVEISTLWYDGANIIAQKFSQQYNISKEQAAGIIASLSPQKDWYMNVRLAELVMMAFDANPIMTEDMVNKQILINKEGLKTANKKVEKAEKIYNENATPENEEKLKKLKENYEKNVLKSDKVIALLKGYIGKDLNSAPPALKAYFVRLYHEINTTKDYNELRPDGEVLDLARKDNGQKAKVGWGSYVEIGKAVSIYLDGSQENITKSLGEMHKIRNFYNNIIDPMSADNDVTMDTHAVAAALLMALSGKSKQVNQNFGTGTSNSSPLGIKGLYYAFADGYILAAKEVGLLPRQVQSITWEAIRGVFTNSFKNNKQNVSDIDKIWSNYQSGKKNINATRKEIIKRAGGFKDPTWAREKPTVGAGPVQAEPRVSASEGGVGRGGRGVKRGAVGGRAGGGAGVEVTSKSQTPSAAEKIVKVGRANGFSEDAIRIVLQNKGFAQDVIDRAMKVEGAAVRFELSEEMMPGYDDTMAKVEGIINKVLAERGGTQERAFEAAMAYLQQDSKLYQDATAVQQEKLVRDLRKRFGLKEKAAPSVGKLFGEIKDVKNITMSERSLLVKQMKDLARGARNAKDAINKARAAVLKSLQDSVNSGKLTANQVYNLMKRFDKMNVLNPEAIDKFVTYASKIFVDADYAQKLSTARATQKEISKLSRNKEKNANLRQLAKEFLEIDPSMVDDIDAYNDMASKIKESIKGSKIVGSKVSFAEMVNINEASDFINEELRKQKEKLFQYKVDEIQELMGVDASDLSYEQLLEILKKDKPITKYNESIIRTAINRMFDTYSTIINSMLSTGKDAFTGEDVDFTDSQKKLVTRFMDIDLSNLDPKQALEMIDALSNFLQNKSTAKMETVLAQYAGRENAKKIVQKGIKSQPLKKYWSKGFGRFLGEQTTNLSLLFEKMFKGFNRGGLVEDYMGMTALRNKKSLAQREANNIVNDYVNAFYNRKANGEAFNTEYNNIERGMAAFMMRNIIGTEQEMSAEFERRRTLVEQSIEALSRGNENEQKKAEIYRQAYEKIVRDSTTIEEVAAKTDATNLEAIDFWHNQWESKYDQLSDVSMNVYNKILGRDINYNPDRFSKLSTDTGIVEISNDDSAFHINNGTIYTQETGVLMSATRPESLPTNPKNGEVSRYIDLSFDKNNSNSMYDALVDINTAASIRQVEAFLNSPSFRSIVPDAQDAKLIKERVALFVRNIRNKNPFSNDELSNLVRKLNKLAAIGVGQALGGFFQPIKQMIPVAMNTLVNAGNLDINAIFNEGKNNFINNSGYAIASRGIESQAQIESINKLIKLASQSTGQKAIDLIEKANKKWLEIFLVKPDVFIARASWITYYEKSLKDQGIDTKGIDYNTHELNEKAANYAQRMVDRQQNVSDADLSGKLFSDKDTMKQLFVKMLMPFASFRLNQSTRLGSDVAVMMDKTSTKEDKVIAARSLAGFGVEMATFKMIATGSAILLGSLAKFAMGKDEDDDEFEKRLNNVIKGQMTGAFNDIVSPNPVLDRLTQMGGSGLLEFIQDIVDVSEEDKISMYSGTEQNFIQSLGTFGISADRALQLFEMIYLSQGGSFKDKYNKEKYLTEDDQEAIKLLIAPALLVNMGLMPSEVNSIVRYSLKDAKKDASAKPGQGGAKGETKTEKERESKIQDLEELRDKETDPQIIEEIDQEIEYLNKDSKGKKAENKKEKEELEELLQGYDNKTEMKRYDPKLYERTFGERSEYYKKNKDEIEMKKKLREMKTKAEDIERGYRAAPKPKRRRNSDGTYKRA